MERKLLHRLTDTDRANLEDVIGSLEARAKNAGELIAQLDAIFATKTRDEWGEVFAQEEDLWWAPVASIDDVVADPQLRAAGALPRQGH